MGFQSFATNSIRIEYTACTKDENNFIASGGTWTADYRGGCLVEEIHSTLKLNDGSVVECARYESEGTGYSEFYIIWIDDVCCLRSCNQSTTECTRQDDTYIALAF